MLRTLDSLSCLYRTGKGLCNLERPGKAEYLGLALRIDLVCVVLWLVHSVFRTNL